MVLDQASCISIYFDMNKVAVFVVSYSIVLLVLFGVMCFLMSTVNPPRVKVEDRFNTVTETSLASFYLRNREPSEVVEYGLEKSYDSLSLRESQGPSRKILNMTNLLPTVRHKNPHIVKVYPPIWPPTTRTTTLTSTKANNIHQLLTASTKAMDTRTDRLIQNITTSITVAETTTVLSESPIHRRSINALEKKVDIESRSVILKILGDHGQSRVEIKLSPNEIFDNKKPRIYRNSLKPEPKPKLSMVLEGTGRDVDINELPDNVEIKILPNDTVVIANELHDSGTTAVELTNVTGATRRVDSMLTNQHFVRIKKPEKLTVNLYTVKNITVAPVVIKTDAFTTQTPKIKKKTSVFNTDAFNTTFTELFGLKVMFDNITRSFTEPYVYVSENKTILF